MSSSAHTNENTDRKNNIAVVHCCNSRIYREIWQDVRLLLSSHVSITFIFYFIEGLILFIVNRVRQEGMG